MKVRDLWVAMGFADEEESSPASKGEAEVSSEPAVASPNEGGSEVSSETAVEYDPAWGEPFGFSFRRSDVIRVLRGAAVSMGFAAEEKQISRTASETAQSVSAATEPVQAKADTKKVLAPFDGTYQAPEGEVFADKGVTPFALDADAGILMFDESVFSPASVSEVGLNEEFASLGPKDKLGALIPEIGYIAAAFDGTVLKDGFPTKGTAIETLAGRFVVERNLSSSGKYATYVVHKESAHLEHTQGPFVAFVSRGAELLHALEEDEDGFKGVSSVVVESDDRSSLPKGTSVFRTRNSEVLQAYVEQHLRSSSGDMKYPEFLPRILGAFRLEDGRPILIAESLLEGENIQVVLAEMKYTIVPDAGSEADDNLRLMSDFLNGLSLGNVRRAADDLEGDDDANVCTSFADTSAETLKANVELYQTVVSLLLRDVFRAFNLMKKCGFWHSPLKPANYIVSANSAANFTDPKNLEQNWKGKFGDFTSMEIPVDASQDYSNSQERLLVDLLDEFLHNDGVWDAVTETLQDMHSSNLFMNRTKAEPALKTLYDDLSAFTMIVNDLSALILSVKEGKFEGDFPQSLNDILMELNYFAELLGLQIRFKY